MQFVFSAITPYPLFFLWLLLPILQVLAHTLKEGTRNITCPSSLFGLTVKHWSCSHGVFFPSLRVSPAFRMLMNDLEHEWGPLLVLFVYLGHCSCPHCQCWGALEGGDSNAAGSWPWLEDSELSFRSPLGHPKPCYWIPPVTGHSFLLLRGSFSPSLLPKQEVGLFWGMSAFCYGQEA